MSIDDQARVLAVVAAVGLLTVQWWPWAFNKFFDGMAAASLWVHDHWLTLSRVVAAGLIVVAAWGVVPIPQVSPTPSITVETPSAEMRSNVSAVAAKLASLKTIDRLLWSSVWSKAAIVVAGDAAGREVAFTDTRSLRGFTALTLDIAWRRIGGHAPGSIDGLKEAVESAYANAVGTEEVPVTKDVRDRYAEFARAMAWAGLNGE